MALFKTQYQETDFIVNKETWEQYWNRMAIDRTWVDYWFIQATAWYLQLNIWIVATSSTDNSPYIEISGNLGDGIMPCDGPIITLGTKSNVHYQSLLPIESFHFGFHENQQDPDAQLHETRKTFNAMANRQNEIPKNATNVQVVMENLNNEEVDIEEIDQFLDTKIKEIPPNAVNGNLDIDEADMEKIDQYLNSERLEITPEFETGILDSEKKRDPNPKKKEITSDKKLFETDETEEFIYESSGHIFAFLKMSDDYQMRCPFCQT